MQQNAPTLKSCYKLLHWAGKAYLLVWRILLHLAGMVFVISRSDSVRNSRIPHCILLHLAWFMFRNTAFCCIISRVLREYPWGLGLNTLILPAILTKTSLSSWLIVGITVCIIQSILPIHVSPKVYLLCSYHEVIVYKILYSGCICSPNVGVPCHAESIFENMKKPEKYFF